MMKTEMRGVGYTAGMEETKNACNILAETMQRRNNSVKLPHTNTL
jgi:hypothetical protein